MNHFRSAACLLCLYPLVMQATGKAGTSDEPGAREKRPSLEESWRETRYCGPNALYLLLRMNGWKGQLAEVRKEIPLGPQGCTMMDLWRTAERLGFTPLVEKTDLAGLGRSTNLPSIVHVDSAYGQGRGHFMVVLSVANSPSTGEPVVTVLDPNLLTTHELASAMFLKNWSTYVFTVSEAPRHDGLAGMGLLVAGMGLLFVPWLVNRVVRRSAS